uniref:Cytochrome P450 n=1 Tax=Graphocephala atropunctata TaxID=36148 RepID=A0A1B6LUI8_9HEMI
MIVELTLFAVLLIFLRLVVFKSRRQRLYEAIPGPRSYPIIGSLLEFNYPTVEVTETLKQLSFKYGPVYMVRLGKDPVVCIRRPPDIEIVLGSTSMIDKAPLYWPLYPWLNRGLLTSGGDKWRKHRKILTPAFHFKVLEKFVPVFEKNAHILVKKLAGMVGKEFNIMPTIALCSLDIISETAMGLEVNAQVAESKYVKAVNELQEIIAHRNFDMIGRTFIFDLLPVGRRHAELISYLHSVTENVMKERKAKLQEEVIDEDGDQWNEDMGIRKKKAFLDLLLEYNKEGAGMSDTEIREEVDTFLFEGYDTTSSTLSFCLYCLSQHQDVQDKAFEELNGIFGGSDRETTFQDFQEMKYLEKVIKETLRLYPTVQFIARYANKDLELTGGYTVPKETSILILIETMNHDPELFPDPFKFDPERFDTKLSHPYGFVPFSAGPRNCIGQKYAMLEVKSVVSLVLRKFRLLPSDIPITSWFNIVLKSKTGINLSFEPRT